MKKTTGSIITRALALLGVASLALPPEASAEARRADEEFRERMERRRAREPRVHSRSQWHTAPATAFYVTEQGTVHESVAGVMIRQRSGAISSVRLLRRAERRALVNVHAWRLLGMRSPRSLGIDAIDAIDRAGREAKRAQRRPKA